MYGGGAGSRTCSADDRKPKCRADLHGHNGNLGALETKQGRSDWDLVKSRESGSSGRQVGDRVAPRSPKSSSSGSLRGAFVRPRGGRAPDAPSFLLSLSRPASERDDRNGCGTHASQGGRCEQRYLRQALAGIMEVGRREADHGRSQYACDLRAVDVRARVRKEALGCLGRRNEIVSPHLEGQST